MLTLYPLFKNNHFLIILLTNNQFRIILVNNLFLIIYKYNKYRLIVQLRLGENIINYKDIANEVNRSPTTIRKWCPRIIELSGYHFTFKKIYRGRNKEPLKQFVFTDDDLIKFKELAKLLTETNDFNYSVFEVYGNLKYKREQDFKKDIDDLDDYYFNEIDRLRKKIKELETNNLLLNNKLSTLEQFNSRLKKIEIGLRKKNIGDLLNDKFKN